MNVQELQDAALAAIAAATTEAALRDEEVAALGKKGSITELSKLIAAAPPAERGPIGKAINTAKQAVTQAIEARRAALVDEAIRAETQDLGFDITLPGARPGRGSLHPLTIVQEQLEDIFLAMGFDVLDYYEVEDDFHNFEALNIPAHHPARDMHDTFWTKDGLVLRTHTSPGQIRAMRELKPPFRAAFPGKVYRCEALDASHEHTFHQLEGLMVDRKVSVANLISTMRIILSQVFEREVVVRLRPGYFPFVEPGFELDMQCLLCGGSGCRVCKQSGWVETLGCGLVHPNVLRHAGLDPHEWQAWAFGMGLSRLVMMRYGIDDIRNIMGGDLRFLQQFSR
jgi:phenylalanyl-tRNA synthetase alpha chain